jgi:hypothetical protein
MKEPQLRKENSQEDTNSMGVSDALFLFSLFFSFFFLFYSFSLGDKCVLGFNIPDTPDMNNAFFNT